MKHGRGFYPIGTLYEHVNPQASLAGVHIFVICFFFAKSVVHNYLKVNRGEITFLFLPPLKTCKKLPYL